MGGVVVRAATGVLCVLVLAGCPKTEKVEADAGPKASTDSSTSPSTTFDAKTVIVNGCRSCHSQPMLEQQRLTEAQWLKVVTKMVTWGANVEPTEVKPLVSFLAASYGPDAGEYEAETIAAADALSELAVLPDGPIPAGDAARGKLLYIEKCSGCHGADARGATGVNLIDRPILYRAGELAMLVRKGRGKMLPLNMADGEIGDVLAHLRSLKNALQ
jgi:mono/diheme cytochrome c family protein